jgi:uncharacterized sulfatase
MIIPKNNDPYVAPKQYFDMYPTEGVVLPSERVDDWDNKPRAAKWTNPLHFGLNKEKQQRRFVLIMHPSVLWIHRSAVA